MVITVFVWVADKWSVDILPHRLLHYNYLSMPVGLMPVMGKVATEKEPIDVQANCQSPPSFRASGPAGTAAPLPVSSATELLIPSCLVAMKKPLDCSHEPLLSLHRCGLADFCQG